jgi:hypothetical protein
MLAEVAAGCSTAHTVLTFRFIPTPRRKEDGAHLLKNVGEESVKGRPSEFKVVRASPPPLLRRVAGEKIISIGGIYRKQQRK